MAGIRHLPSGYSARVRGRKRRARGRARGSELNGSAFGIVIIEFGRMGMTWTDGVISYLLSFAATETSLLVRVLCGRVRRTNINLRLPWPLLGAALFFWTFAASTVDAMLRPHVYHVDGPHMRVIAGGMVLIAILYSIMLVLMFLTIHPSRKEADSLAGSKA
jgi:hypothetical protein